MRLGIEDYYITVKGKYRFCSCEITLHESTVIRLDVRVSKDFLTGLNVGEVKALVGHEMSHVEYTKLRTYQGKTSRQIDTIEVAADKASMRFCSNIDILSLLRKINSGQMGSLTNSQQLRCEKRIKVLSKIDTTIERV